MQHGRMDSLAAFFTAIVALFAPAPEPELIKGSRHYQAAEMDAFAAEILGGLQKTSFAENREYCGLFVMRDGALMATRAVRGRAYSCTIPYPDDASLTLVASYHTHAGDDPMADGEVPSTTDLESDMADGIPGYVATPGGRLWRTDPVRREVVLICEKGCVARDPRFVDCPRRNAGTRHTLHQLRLREQTMDGTCDISDR